MNRPVRYILALLVGIGLAALAARVSNTSVLPVIAVAVVYTATTSLVITYWDDWAYLSSRSRSSSRALGALGGGVGAFGGSTLLQVSVPVGMIGLGLYIFGVALTIADVSPIADE